MIRIDRVHGGNPSDGALDFSASINPFGPPRAALDAYHASVADIASYPPAYPRHLEAALAQWLGLEPEWVLAGNGSTQLIYLLARVLKPRFPVIVTPTFSEIANSLIIEGIEPRALNTTGDCNFPTLSRGGYRMSSRWSGRDIYRPSEQSDRNDPEDRRSGEDSDRVRTPRFLVRVR